MRDRWEMEGKGKGGVKWWDMDEWRWEDEDEMGGGRRCKRESGRG